MLASSPLSLARAARARGALGESVNHYLAIIREDPSPEVLAEASEVIGRLRPGAAETLARRALEQRPRLPEALHALGESLARQGRYADAVGPLQEAVGSSGRLAEIKDAGTPQEASPWTTRYPAVACPACGAAAGAPVHVGNASRVQRCFGVIDPVKIWFRCGQCTLVRVLNPPPEGRLSEWYEAAYNRSPDTHNPPVVGPALYQDLLKAEAQVARLLASFPALRGGRLLEVGAAFGVFLAAARYQGFECTGMELAERAVNWGKATLGVELRRGSCPADLPEGDFDAVVLFEVIEHFLRPDEVLATLARRLRPNGVLLLSTPCLDHPYHLAAGYDDPMWSVPGHLVYYDRATLRAALARAGLREVDRWFSDRHLGSVMVVATAA